MSRLRLIRDWREVVEKAVGAILRVCPASQVYLFGGAAEDRLTVCSDVDLAVVPGREGCSLAAIWEELERADVPSYYPLEIVVLGLGELERLRGAKRRLA